MKAFPFCRPQGIPAARQTLDAAPIALFLTNYLVLAWVRPVFATPLRTWPASAAICVQGISCKARMHFVFATMHVRNRNPNGTVFPCVWYHPVKWAYFLYARRSSRAQNSNAILHRLLPPLADALLLVYTRSLCVEVPNRRRQGSSRGRRADVCM